LPLLSFWYKPKVSIMRQRNLEKARAALHRAQAETTEALMALRDWGEQDRETKCAITSRAEAVVASLDELIDTLKKQPG
jgi:methylmalonyl-CoA mutase N-terminal domain/subunit